MRETNKIYESSKKFTCAPADEALGSPNSLEFNLRALEYFRDVGTRIFPVSKNKIEKKQAEILKWLSKIENCVRKLYFIYCQDLGIRNDSFLAGQKTTLIKIIRECQEHLEKKYFQQLMIDYECIKNILESIMQYIDESDYNGNQ